MIFENKYIIMFVDLVMLKKIVAIFFMIFALVTGRVPKLFILTFVSIIDIQCQIWAHVFELIPAAI